MDLFIKKKSTNPIEINGFVYYKKKISQLKKRYLKYVSVDTYFRYLIIGLALPGL